MLILSSWLKEIVPYTVSVDQLADDLTLVGLEVEAVEPLVDKENVVAAMIVQVSAHPTLDKLKVCQVDSGNGKTFQVVCGADNCVTGMTTVFALPGALIKDQQIKTTVFNGVESYGMLCSHADIGTKDDHSGIININEEDVTPGDSICNISGFDDSVIEIGITPNRSDCLSLYGIAREVGALYGLSQTLPECKEDIFSGKSDISVKIEAPDLCRRYAAASIQGVKITSSPFWLKKRLAASGIRSVNNVVDVTNYVMLELGQPMHAFDLATLTGPEIIVRTAKGEAIRTLDGKEYIFEEGMLAICDQQDPVAIAGVMGGYDSQVKESTTSILLESAFFEPSQVRRTAKKFKIPSESSYRFERGIDPLITLRALARAVDLIIQLAGGRFVGSVDVNPVQYKSIYLDLDPFRANKLIGIDISPGEMKKMLDSVGIDTDIDKDGGLRCKVPSWRPDIKEYVDLVEEVARLYGFDKIPVRIPEAVIAGREEDPFVFWTGRVKDKLSGFGMSEVISYSFISEKEIQWMDFPSGDRRCNKVNLKNPLTEDQAVMRTTLLPSLLAAVGRNCARRNLNLRFFEIGSVYYDNGTEALPDEEQRLAGVLTGLRNPDSWAWTDDKVDFFDVKGVVEGLLYTVGASEKCSFKSVSESSWLVADASQEIISLEGSRIGVIGMVAKHVLKAFDIEHDVYAFDLFLNELVALASESRSFKPLNPYPAIELDIAIILDEKIDAEEIVGFVKSKGIDFLESCTVFDVYHGKQVPKASKSLGVRFVYRDSERTLSEDDVSVGHKAAVDDLMKRFEAVFRA